MNPCPPGKIRNPETGRCVDRNGEIGRRIIERARAQQAAQPQAAQVVQPQVANADPCPAGMIRNPETGRCVKRDGAIGRQIIARAREQQEAQQPQAVQPQPQPQPQVVANIQDVNLSLFYETCQYRFEESRTKTVLNDTIKKKIVKYLLDPIVYLPLNIITALVDFYDTEPMVGYDERNISFYGMIYNPRHISLLTNRDLYGKKYIDAQLLISQWLAWYYQHTLKEAKELIEKLRNNLAKIRRYLPNVYKPNLYADLFEDFFVNDKSVRRIETDAKYRELNFVLHVGDADVYSNRIVDKMMTGLRNFNLLHEWIDARLAENDEDSLDNAKDKCKLGKAGAGWMCGDGMFDSIPVLLAEAEASIKWERKANRDDEIVYNFQSIATALLSKSGMTKAHFPNGYNGRGFLDYLMNLVWANKTFRTNFGYNDRERLIRMFDTPNGLLRNYYDTDVVEVVFDSLNDH